MAVGPVSSSPEASPRSRRRPGLTLVLTGLALIVLQVALAAISPFLFYQIGTPPALTFVATGLLIAAGLVWLLSVLHVREGCGGRWLLPWVIGVGAVLRGITLFSQPILETDYYRYLWDGGVTAHGLNPYAFAPNDAMAGPGEGAPVAAELGALAEQSGQVIRRVSYPELRTIYPPVAQCFFALAHWLRPWSLTAWRVVALGLDGATLLLLIALLRAARLPLASLVIYWWNPLVVKELINTAHMEVAVLPFVVGALLLAARGRPVWAAGSLALGVGAKLWPIILLPLLLRPLFAAPRKLLAALGVFALVVGAVFLPVYWAGLDESSGFVAYARGWEMNDGLFMCLSWAAAALGGGPTVARAGVAAAVVLAALLLSRTAPRDASDLCGRALLIIAVMFLLSPTQFPWYYVWMVPLLAVRPRGSLLLYTALLPLYYLRFAFKTMGNVNAFDYGIVWVEHAPVICLLLWEWRRGSGWRLAHPPAAGEGEVQ